MRKVIYLITFGLSVLVFILSAFVSVPILFSALTTSRLYLGNWDGLLGSLFILIPIVVSLVGAVFFWRVRLGLVASKWQYFLTVLLWWGVWHYTVGTLAVLLGGGGDSAYSLVVFYFTVPLFVLTYLPLLLFRWSLGGIGGGRLIAKIFSYLLVFTSVCLFVGGLILYRSKPTRFIGMLLYNPEYVESICQQIKWKQVMKQNPDPVNIPLVTEESVQNRQEIDNFCGYLNPF